MYHTISYCDKDKYNLKYCDKLENNTIISCPSCDINEGFWYYNNNRKILLPYCFCPTLINKLGLNTNNICNLNKKVRPIHIFGSTLTKNDNIEYILKKFLKNDNIKYYYNCNNYIPEYLDTDIICEYNNELIVIPYILWDNTYNLNLINKLDDKLINCKSDPYTCYKNLFENNNFKNNIKQLPPKCFYQIPIMVYLILRILYKHLIKKLKLEGIYVIIINYL